MKAIYKQYFAMVLSIMLYKMVLAFIMWKESLSATIQDKALRLRGKESTYCRYL